MANECGWTEYQTDRRPWGSCAQPPHPLAALASQPLAREARHIICVVLRFRQPRLIHHFLSLAHSYPRYDGHAVWMPAYQNEEIYEWLLQYQAGEREVS